MLATAQIIVVTVGIAVALISLWGIAYPLRLMTTVRTVMDGRWGMPLAIGVRVVLGLSLLAAAPAAKYVIAFKALGWLALIAAAALPIVGRQRMIAMLDWVQRLSRHLIRLWLVFGVLFGVFLLYGINLGSLGI